MKWSTYGPHALLIHFAERADDNAFKRGRSIVAWLEQKPPPGLLEFVPAFTSILLRFDPQIVPQPALVAPALIKAFKTAARQKAPPSLIKEIPVTYGGPDLERVAKLNKLRPDQIPALHSAPIYMVYALGFAPGFLYLGDLPRTLHTPRLDSPRTRVPAGSVAIGGQHTGIYPVDSPGGWNIIGRTTIKLFDPEQLQTGARDEDAFFLRHGDRVRFVPIGKMKSGSL